MEIKVNELRLSEVTIDLSGKDAVWYVRGYYITDKNKILGEFRACSRPSVVMTNEFIPTQEVQDLSSQFLTAIHRNIEGHLGLEYER